MRPAPAAPGQRVRALFTLEGYLRLGEIGLIASDDRTELINGEVYFVPPDTRGRR